MSMLAPQKDLSLRKLINSLAADPTLHPILFDGLTPKGTTSFVRAGNLGEVSINCPAVGKGPGTYLEMNFVIGTAGLDVLKNGLDGLWRENFQPMLGTPERLKTWELKDGQHRVKLSIPEYVVSGTPIVNRLDGLIKLLGDAHKAAPISV